MSGDKTNDIPPAKEISSTSIDLDLPNGLKIRLEKESLGSGAAVLAVLGGTLERNEQRYNIVAKFYRLEEQATTELLLGGSVGDFINKTPDLRVPQIFLSLSPEELPAAFTSLLKTVGINLNEVDLILIQERAVGKPIEKSTDPQKFSEIAEKILRFNRLMLEKGYLDTDFQPRNFLWDEGNEVLTRVDFDRVKEWGYSWENIKEFISSLSLTLLRLAGVSLEGKSLNELPLDRVKSLVSEAFSRGQFNSRRYLNLVFSWQLIENAYKIMEMIKSGVVKEPKQFLYLLATLIANVEDKFRSLKGKTSEEVLAEMLEIPPEGLSNLSFTSLLDLEKILLEKEQKFVQEKGGAQEALEKIEEQRWYPLGKFLPWGTIRELILQIKEARQVSAYEAILAAGRGDFSLARELAGNEEFILSLLNLQEALENPLVYLSPLRAEVVKRIIQNIEESSPSLAIFLKHQLASILRLAEWSVKTISLIRKSQIEPKTVIIKELLSALRERLPSSQAEGLFKEVNLPEELEKIIESINSALKPIDLPTSEELCSAIFIPPFSLKELYDSLLSLPLKEDSPEKAKLILERAPDGIVPFGFIGGDVLERVRGTIQKIAEGKRVSPEEESLVFLACYLEGKTVEDYEKNEEVKKALQSLSLDSIRTIREITMLLQLRGLLTVNFPSEISEAMYVGDFHSDPLGKFDPEKRQRVQKSMEEWIGSVKQNLPDKALGFFPWLLKIYAKKAEELLQGSNNDVSGKESWQERSRFVSACLITAALYHFYEAILSPEKRKSLKENLERLQKSYSKIESVFRDIAEKPTAEEWKEEGCFEETLEMVGAITLVETLNQRLPEIWRFRENGRADEFLKNQTELAQTVERIRRILGEEFLEKYTQFNPLALLLREEEVRTAESQIAQGMDWNSEVKKLEEKLTWLMELKLKIEKIKNLKPWEAKEELEKITK